MSNSSKSHHLVSNFFSWWKFHNETECCILGFFLSEFYLYLYRVFGGGKIISQNDVIGRWITPFVLIYHTVYCWGFELSLKKNFFGDACRSTFIWFFWYVTRQGYQDRKKCDAIRNFILQRFSWDQTTWAIIMWPCSILLPLCLDQFNSSLQIEQLRNSLFSVNYVINAFLFPVFTYVSLKWKLAYVNKSVQAVRLMWRIKMSHN